MNGIEFELLENFVDVHGHPREAVARYGVLGLTVAAQVECEHPVGRREPFELWPEEFRGLRPAGSQEQGLAGSRPERVEHIDEHELDLHGVP